MTSPLVSVVMSVCNEEIHLKDTIESILNQTIQDFEFIIVDDGSNDRTPDILDSYKNRDKRFYVISNSKNTGIARALNIGIGEASCKYIALMDAGDISHPRRFEKQVDFLENRKDVFILGTQGQWIDTNHKVIGSWKLPLNVTDREVYKTGGAIHPSIMVRRELFDLVGLYKPELEMSQEFEMYLRTIKNGLKIANLEDPPLISVMERKSGMTDTHLKTIQKNQLIIKIQYLKYFLSLGNIFYTIRSCAGYLIPDFMLKRIIKNTRRQ